MNFMFLPLEHKIHIFSPPCNILYLSCRISIFYVQTLSGLYQGEEKWLLNKKAGALIRRGSANSVLQLLVTFFCPVGIQKLIVNLRVDAKVQLQVLVRRLSYKIMRFLIREPNFVGIFTFPGWSFPVIVPSLIF